MISRNYTWLDDNIEHDESTARRAAALAAKWSALKTRQEERSFRRQAEIEEGSDPDFDTEEEHDAYTASLQAIREEEQLEIDIVERMLDELGARMKRPYEHWNEDEQLMKYLEGE